MFRSFIYLDEEKLYTYKRQIDGKNTPQPKAIRQKKAIGLEAALPRIGMSGALETEVSGDYARDVSFDYDQFEASLETLGGESYFDCVLNADYDLPTVPPMKLARICSNFIIPETFDLVTLMEQYKPLIMDRMKASSSSDQEAIESILGQASADIPFVVELDDFSIAGKLKAKYLLEPYASLEDYSEQEVYMLCKIVGLVHKDQVEIFDPLKDFIRLPRVMRRKIGDNGKTAGLEKIFVEGPVLKVEVIAIYK